MGFDRKTKGYHYYNPKMRTLHIINDIKVNERCFWYVYATTTRQPHATLEVITSHLTMIEMQDPFTSHSLRDQHRGTHSNDIVSSSTNECTLRLVTPVSIGPTTMDLIKHPWEEAPIVHNSNPSPIHGIDASTQDTNHSSPQFTRFSCVKTFSSKLNDYVAHIESFTEPEDFTKAMSDLAWHNAMNWEKVTIKSNKAWILVDLLIGCYLVSTKRLFKINMD